MEHENQSFLPNVYGLWGIKSELKLILHGYQDPQSIGKRKAMLPRGLLFFGDPGCGKTLLTREYSKLFHCPVFEIEGNSEDVQKELVEVYEKASQEPMAIVVIDEMDKLVSKDDKLTRILQSQLDGFKLRLNVLTLATANERIAIPEPLLREGRFDRQFDVELDGKEETEEALRNFLAMAGVSLKEEDIPELVDEFHGDSPIHIRSAIFAAALRKGDACTMEDIIDSSYFLHCGTMPKKEELEVSRHTAIHEAGHAAFLHFYARCITYGRIYFTPDGGFTTIQRDKMTTSLESVNERIQCDLAGLIAEELLLGHHDYGSHSDLDDAHRRAYQLANMQAINGVGEHCLRSAYYEPSEKLSQIKVHSFEVACEKYVLHQYKLAKRRMRKIKKEVLRLALFLLKNKKASKQDIARILGPRKPLLRRKVERMVENGGEWWNVV